MAAWCIAPLLEINAAGDAFNGLTLKTAGNTDFAFLCHKKIIGIDM